MKHSDKDIEAADAYAGQFNNPTYEQNAFKAFLAGLEHKQKDVDELVEALDYANHAIRMLIASKPMRDIDETLTHQDKLIQKHKR